MTSQLSTHPHLIHSLIPTMPVGCRRITSSTNYLSSLCSSNVVVETSPIKTITSTGLVIESKSDSNPPTQTGTETGTETETLHEDLDAIICATGFNTSFLPRFPIIGDAGLNLQDAWSEEMGGPRAYMSMMAEGMPNYFRKFPFFCPFLLLFIPPSLPPIQSQSTISIRIRFLTTPPNRNPRPQRPPSPRRRPPSQHTHVHLRALAHHQDAPRELLFHPSPPHRRTRFQ